MTVKIIYYFFSYFSVALILSVALVPTMRYLSFKVGAVDRGIGRRVHKGIIPRLGGVAIFTSFIIPVAFSLTRGQWDAFHDKVIGVLISSAIVLMIGIYDDIKGATVRNKLLAETVAAIIIYIWGVRITQISNPFGGVIALGLMDLPVTVLWIIAVTNAFNLIDGMDGLAAGTGILISATLLSLTGEFHFQLTYVILIGSLLGFLVYNFPPASIFMGDSGSLFIGFLLGSTSILSSHKATAIATMMIPIIAFSFPLMDMLYAVLRRYYRGLPLGEADREHIHHKLLERGLSKRKVLLLLYLLNICIMLVVLLFIRRQLNMDFIGLILLAAVSVFGLRLLGYVEFMPFIREMLRNFDIGRKRKYFNYVIKKFRHNAAKSKTLDDLCSHLTILMKEYGLNFAEIYFDLPSIKNPVYAYSSRLDPDKALTLSFPILTENDGPVGAIRLSKDMDEDYFLCTTEMARALSEEVSRFLMNNPEPLSPCEHEGLIYNERDQSLT
jgi:UDP-GlcNAc:undecaprenyl-phosphate/decaprenyl-phosphate GlcNAc-1-phosphate transferase